MPKSRAVQHSDSASAQTGPAQPDFKVEVLPGQSVCREGEAYEAGDEVTLPGDIAWALTKMGHVKLIGPVE